MNKKQPNIAVIGSGYWGKNLVRNYHELGALKLICDKTKPSFPVSWNSTPASTPASP